MYFVCAIPTTIYAIQEHCINPGLHQVLCDPTEKNVWNMGRVVIFHHSSVFFTQIWFLNAPIAWYLQHELIHSFHAVQNGFDAICLQYYFCVFILFFAHGKDTVWNLCLCQKVWTIYVGPNLGGLSECKFKLSPIPRAAKFQEIKGHFNLGTQNNTWYSVHQYHKERSLWHIILTNLIINSCISTSWGNNKLMHIIKAQNQFNGHQFGCWLFNYSASN